MLVSCSVSSAVAVSAVQVSLDAPSKWDCLTEIVKGGRIVDDGPVGGSVTAGNCVQLALTKPVMGCWDEVDGGPVGGPVGAGNCVEYSLPELVIVWWYEDDGDPVGFPVGAECHTVLCVLIG